MRCLRSVTRSRRSPQGSAGRRAYNGAMSVIPTTSGPLRPRDGGLPCQPGARRVFLAWLLLPLTIKGAWASQPDSHGLGLEERIRLRRELRQAHRDRMRDANPPSQASEATVSAANHEESAPGPASESGTPPPEPGGSSPVRHEGWGGRDMVGGHHGRMALSDEEREQLRRQLREQRALRRGASRGADEGSSPSPPQP